MTGGLELARRAGSAYVVAAADDVAYDHTGARDGDEFTVGQERQSNLALTLDDEDTFVAKLLGGLTAYPRYYAHMAPINRAGPSDVDLVT